MDRDILMVQENAFTNLDAAGAISPGDCLGCQVSTDPFLKISIK